MSAGVMPHPGGWEQVERERERQERERDAEQERRSRERRGNTVRWQERRDGRDAGRVDSALPTPGGGCLTWLPAVPLVVAVSYYAVHALVWLARVVIP